MAVYVLYWIDRALGERRPHEYFVEADKLREEANKHPPGTAAHTSYLEQADDCDARGRDRLMRRTILISAGIVAVAVAS